MRLSHKISLYIPSTVNGNQPASQETIDKFVSMAKNKFANMFGGFTVVNAQGGYMSPEHGLIEESITIVYSFCSSDQMANVPDIRQFAQLVAKGMQQECVSVEVDGSVEFVEAA